MGLGLPVVCTLTALGGAPSPAFMMTALPHHQAARLLCAPLCVIIHSYIYAACYPILLIFTEVN